MDLRFVIGGGEVLLGMAMAGLGAWQYVIARPLPGALGGSLRPGHRIDDLRPRRWQLSGGAQGFFGLGFLVFGAAPFLEGHIDEAGLGALRTAGVVAWVLALGMVSVLMTRYRHRA
jgi:hypothetical protein